MKYFKACILCAITFFCGAFNALVAEEVDATLEIAKKFGNLPTIIVESNSFVGSSTDKAHSMRVSKMLAGDLRVTGHFNVQEGETSNNELVVDFDVYRQQKVNLIARVHATPKDKGLEATLRLYDANVGRMVIEKQYSVNNAERFPFLAHEMAIDTNDYIQAPKVDWMRRLVVLSRYVNPGQSEILYADYTLTFRQTLIRGGLNIFPKWANREQTGIYYTKYLERPTLFHYNFKTGRSEPILDSNGMMVASDVSNDGKKLLLTMAPKEQADIYLFDIESRNLRRLTNYSGIDVSANFIDNEKRVMFVSDRLGYPNIFSVPLAGEATSTVEQMVFHGRNNNAASAYGDYIVYSSRESSEEFSVNTFNLYLISTKSDYIRRLTANGINQFPRFSHDGETIMFLKILGNQSSLGIIRLNYNKTSLFPLTKGSIQSMDW